MRMHQAISFFLSKYPNQHTRRTYALTLKKFQQAVGAEREVAWITPVEVQRYINDQIALGLSDWTIWKYFKELKVFFNFLVRMELIESSPCRGVKVKRPRIEIDERDVISNNQIEKLLQYVSLQRNIKLEAIVRFLVDTGCRRMGLANLRIPDLDLVHLTAIVKEKGDNKRPVFFSEATKEALERWLELRPACNHNHVFTSGARYDYKPMTAASIAQSVRRACQMAGIGSYGTHTFRHRRGYNMTNAGVDLQVRSVIMGHSDPRITAAYYSDYTSPTVVAEARRSMRKDDDEKSKIIPFNRKVSGTQ